jgi:hypothetical protein
MQFISDFFVHSKLVKGSNFTFITLILNVISPKKLSDYRPISLAGCMYKILSKFLGKRLKLVIDSVISEAHMTHEVVDDA